MRKFGLLGKKLSHTFSPGYFAEKFEKEKINDASYVSFEIETIERVRSILDNPQMSGLNVTIPYKEQIIPFLDELSSEANEIGAVNTVEFINGKSIGHNTDVYGFEKSLLDFLGTRSKEVKALVLGTGGASKAVQFVLGKLGVPYSLVSSSNQRLLQYKDLSAFLDGFHLIVNTTPLGMYPHVDKAPDLPYDLIGPNHFLFDLIYNPEKTLFLKEGQSRGAAILNGYDMLELQAEKSWEIWNNNNHS